MAKVKLTVGEVYALNTELLGRINEANGERITNGLINSELSILVKFKLNDLLSNIAKHIESVDKLRNSLVDKLGKEGEDGKGKFLEYFIKDESGNEIVNPALEEFNKEMNKLYDQEVEIDVLDLKIEDIDFKTTEVFPVVFSIIKKLSESK